MNISKITNSLIALQTTFAGRPNEDGAEWLKDLKRTVELIRRTSKAGSEDDKLIFEEVILTVMRKLLKDRAATWFKVFKVRHGDALNLEKFYAEFNAEFNKSELASKNLENLFSCKQLLDETCRRYGERLLDLNAKPATRYPTTPS